MKARTLLLSVAVAALLPTGAWAQDATPASQSAQPETQAEPSAVERQDTGETTPDGAQPQDIVVTGSRIARSDYVAQSPIVTTEKAAIENAGVPTVDSYLLQLPQFQPGAGGFTNVSSGGLGVGQATLNLRGLGAVRTLVLLDGRRLQPGNAQSVIDVNTIPTSAIANVEVITGGASATYGSDAIAGVVNFKLRRAFEGLELNAQMGVSELGDAPTRQASFIAGHRFADNAGSIILAAEYADRQPIGFRDRAFSTPTGNLAAQLANGYYAPTGSNLPTQAAVNALFGTYGFAAGTVPRTANLGVNLNNSLFRSGAPGTNYQNINDPCVVNNGAAGFGYDGNCTNNLQNGLKRTASLARAEYKVSPALTLFVQGTYAHSLARGQGSHPQATPFGAAGLTVPITNPFIPADLRTVLASRPNPNDSFVYVKRITQAGPRSFTSSTDTYQGLIGAEGQIGGGWTYEVYGSYGRTEATDRSFAGSVSVSAIQRLLLASDGGRSLCDGGFNIFGPAETSASCLDYIQQDTVTRTRITQGEVAGTLSGGLFTLPAGEVKVALSGNYRRTTYRTNPDAALQAGDIAAIVAVQPTAGAISVAEGAAELLVPILSDVTLFQSLNLTAGYRFSHYKPGGDISTYKVNFDWRVFDPLLLRGGYQRAVRAPNIGELFLPPGGVVANIGAPPASGDLCDVRNSVRTGSAAAQLRALCLAQGIPAAIVDTYNQANVGVPSVTQGNRSLRPEEARSYTLGAVLQPRFLSSMFSRMNISVDYYNIRIENVIATLGVQTSFNKCFNLDGSNPDYSVGNFYCSLITRNPLNGQVASAVQPLLNLGGYRTDGIDVQFDWNLPLSELGIGAGRSSLIMNLTASWLGSFRIQQLPGTAFQDFTGTIAGSDTYAKAKLSGSFLYDTDLFQVGVRWRHLSAFRDSSVVTNPASTIAGPGATDYFDIVGRIRAGERYELRLGVTNVGNRQPPQVGALRGFTNPGVYDVIGRGYYVGLKAKF